MRPQLFVLFPMDHLVFLSQRRHQPFATHTTLSAALIPTVASLPSVVVSLFINSNSSSTNQTSMASTCLCFNLHSFRGSKPGIRSLKASPIPLVCLLALRSVSVEAPSCSSTPALPVASSLGLAALLSLPARTPTQLLGNRTNPQPIPESPHCGAHPQHGGVVLVPSWRELAMSFEGARVFSAWHPPPFCSWQMLPHFSGDSCVSTNSFLQACANL